MDDKIIYVPLMTATLAQLRQFAELSLHLTVPKAPTVEGLRRQIALVHDGDITVVEQAPEVSDKRKYTMSDLETSSKYDPIVNITVDLREGEGGNRPIEPAVLGKTMLIPRGIPVDVPYRYYDALRKAERTTYTQAPMGSDVDLIPTHTLTHPFTVNRMPPKAELDEWLEVQGARA